METCTENLGVDVELTSLNKYLRYIEYSFRQKPFPFVFLCLRISVFLLLLAKPSNECVPMSKITRKLSFSLSLLMHDCSFSEPFNRHSVQFGSLEGGDSNAVLLPAKRGKKRKDMNQVQATWLFFYFVSKKNCLCA